MTGENLAFTFIAEHLALDFLNTTSTVRGREEEAVPTFDAALAWFRQAGVLTGADYARLKTFRESKAAADALRDLRAFRTEMRAMLDAYLEHGEVEPAFRKAINERLRELGSFRVLVAEGDGYVLRSDCRILRPRDLIMSLVNAIAELVAYEDLSRLKQCSSECCDMFFLDLSRNRSRTWCDMGACGNRAKAASYYRRSRTLTSAVAGGNAGTYG